MAILPRLFMASANTGRQTGNTSRKNMGGRTFPLQIKARYHIFMGGGGNRTGQTRKTAYRYQDIANTVWYNQTDPIVSISAARLQENA